MKWFLDFGNTIQSILRIGDRTTSLGMECFNDINLFQVCKCLPYTLWHKVYYIEERGRERLVKIIDMVTKERNNVERRASEKNTLRLWDSITVTSRFDVTQGVPDTTVTSMVDIAHEALDTTASLTRTSHSWTSKQASWALLCQGTDKR